MTRRYLRILPVGSLLSLTACAPQSEVRQMHQSISTLNKEMTQLNQETVKITQQNKLNAESTRGVYLLRRQYACPAGESDRYATYDIAGNYACRRRRSRNVTHSGRVPRSAAGIQRYRRVRANSGHYGELSGGECTEPSGKCPASLLAPSDVNISLPLKDHTGAVRLHSHP